MHKNTAEDSDVSFRK